jgi:hypothetical protein
LLPRCILGLALYALTALIRTACVWALHCPSLSTALAAALTAALLASRSAPRDDILLPPLSCGHKTFLKPPMDYME